MANEELKIQSVKAKIDTYSQRSLMLSSFSQKDEYLFHTYIQDICQRLLGDTVNLKDEQIIFALSDQNVTNAAFSHNKKDTFKIIYITEGMLNMCENEDQLAFVLAHELGHYEEYKRQSLHQNTKAEETAADLRAIQKMAKAGYNLEEAHKIAAKLFNSSYISIESLKDPHTNDTTRVNAIDAMIIATRKQVIKDKEKHITHTTPINPEILSIIKERPKSLSFADKLRADVHNTENPEELSKIWLNAFNEALCKDEDGYLSITNSDSQTLASVINTICRKGEDHADALFSSILLHLQAQEHHESYNNIKELMSSVLYEIYTFENSPTRIDTSKPNSKTNAIFKHYLKGFRSAEGDEFDRILQNFDYISSMVAKHYFDTYKGMLVENFNLLELEFNENDIGKQFSKETLKYIRSYINAKDKFETFSSLSVNTAGDNLIIKNEKLSNCTIVNQNGIVEFSFPLEKIDNIYTTLMAKVIENAYHDIQNIINNPDMPKGEKFAKLANAYKIIEPQVLLNNLQSLLQIRSSDKNKKILLEDIRKLLPDDVKTFFDERSQRPYNFSQLPYSNFIVDNMEEYIKSAPKEEYQNILDFLLLHRQHVYSAGKEKLWSAFLENEQFSTILKEKINKTQLLPSSRDEWSFINLFEANNSNFELISIIDNLHLVTEEKLAEHLLNGGSLNSFETPFTKQIGQICGFSTGKFSKEELEKSLNQTRNKDVFKPSFLQKAYMLYYSYDALKDGYELDLNNTCCTNIAGLKIESMKHTFNNYLKDSDTYDVHESEKEHLLKQLKGINFVYDTVYQKLAEQVHDKQNWPDYNIRAIFHSVLYNSDESSTRDFSTILKNKEFLDMCLSGYKIDKERDIAILALESIVNESTLNYENDRIKEQIFPVISSVFSREDLSIYQKTSTLHNLSYYKIFKSDNSDYYNILIGSDGKSGLLKEISQADYATQEKCYMLLLDKEYRIPDPEIRAHIIKNLAIAWHNNHQQYDDRNPNTHIQYYIISEIKKLKESNITASDKNELLKELSELMMSQKDLSLALKPNETNIETSDTKAIFTTYGIDAFAYLINNNPQLKEQTQEFLLGYGAIEDANKLIYEIKLAVCKEVDNKYGYKLTEKFEKGIDIEHELPLGTRDYCNIYKKLNPTNLIAFKKEFDNSSLEIKALIINELLTSGKKDWQSSFEIVSKKLFEGAGDLAQMGSDFLYSYIDARPDSEKTFYLAAMMAAANNKSQSSASNFIDSPYTSEQRNLARGLRLFLENSGPAGTKLAQAMASYSDVPDFIRFEMQFAKSEANPPARWEIFSEQEGGASKLLEQGPLGKRLGSASFFVTYELGDKVVKILRKGAKINADNEFSIYKEMLKTLKGKYNNISSFSRLVDNAANNVKIETDLNIGYSQYLDAKKLYPDTVKADKINFSLKVMDWSSLDATWAVMERAEGVDFKNLTGAYKTAVAKAIFSTELSNMLSGKRFDSDRHGGQYKIDPTTNTIGIFDTGSISMTEPTPKEQEILGMVLAQTLSGLRKAPNIATVFSQAIDRATTQFYKYEIINNKQIPPYLSEFQRGLLALNDFYANLTPKETLECVIAAVSNKHHKINENIISGFKSELAKQLNADEQTVKNIIEPENIEKLSPEARADRRIGIVLFNAAFDASSQKQSFNLPPKIKEKILPKLNNRGSALQIVKGMVRGAWAKINPDNYSAEDKRQLGEILYQVCAQDTANKKLKKDIGIQEIFEQVENQYPDRSDFCKNISNMIKTISSVSSVDSEKIKRTALFIAFYDNDVAKGYKKAALNDKKIHLGKRLIRSLEPMQFIPQKAKRILVKNFGRKKIINYAIRQLLGAKKQNDNQRS